MLSVPMLVWRMARGWMLGLPEGGDGGGGLGGTVGGAEGGVGVLGLSACCWDFGPPQLIKSMVFIKRTRAIAPILTVVASS